MKKPTDRSKSKLLKFYDHLSLLKLQTYLARVFFLESPEHFVHAQYFRERQHSKNMFFFPRKSLTFLRGSPLFQGSQEVVQRPIKNLMNVEIYLFDALQVNFEYGF